MTGERYRDDAFRAWIGIAGHLALAAAGGAGGLLSGSKALTASAIHSAAHAASEAASLMGIVAAQQPHASAKTAVHNKTYAATVVVSILMLIAGVEMGISCLKAIWTGEVKSPHGAATVIILLSIVLKAALFQYKYRGGGFAVIAGAWKQRKDVYASAAALLGAGGAMLGDKLDNSALFYLDPAAGFFIALLIISEGYQRIASMLLRASVHGVRQEEATDLLDTVQRVKGVIAVDDIRAREHGHYVIVDIKLSVNPKITVQEGHDISKIVKLTLMKRFSHISDVFVHVLPYDAGYPYKIADVEQEEMRMLLH